MSRDQSISGPARIPKADADGAGSAWITDVTGPAEVAVPGRPSLVGRFRRGLARAYSLPVALAALTVALVAVFEPQFYRPANLHVLMQQWSVLATLADDGVPGQIKFQCSGWGQPVIDETVEFA